MDHRQRNVAHLTVQFDEAVQPESCNAMRLVTIIEPVKGRIIKNLMAVRADSAAPMLRGGNSYKLGAVVRSVNLDICDRRF